MKKRRSGSSSSRAHETELEREDEEDEQAFYSPQKAPFPSSTREIAAVDETAADEAVAEGAGAAASLLFRVIMVKFQAPDIALHLEDDLEMQVGLGQDPLCATTRCPSLFVRILL